MSVLIPYGKIQLVRQPTHNTCVHACLAMVTGIPVEKIIEELPVEEGIGTSPREYGKWLVRHGVWPVEEYTVSSYNIFQKRLYLLSFLSTVAKGYTHLCVLDARGTAAEDPYPTEVMFDPLTGWPGVETINVENFKHHPYIEALWLIDAWEL